MCVTLGRTRRLGIPSMHVEGIPGIDGKSERNKNEKLEREPI